MIPPSPDDEPWWHEYEPDPIPVSGLFGYALAVLLIAALAPTLLFAALRDWIRR